MTRSSNRNSNTSAKNPVRIGLPSLWFTVLAMLSGVYSTGILYRGLSAHKWGMVGLGLAVLSAAVVVIGTPLAFARYLRWYVKQKR